MNAKANNDYIVYKCQRDMGPLWMARTSDKMALASDDELFRKSYKVLLSFCQHPEVIDEKGKIWIFPVHSEHKRM